MSGIGIRKIGQVALCVDDLAATTAFYRDAMGLKFLFDAAPGMSFFDCGGTRLMLASPAAQGEGPKETVLYYEVGDIEGAVLSLSASGAKLVEQAHRVAKLEHAELWLAVLRDPAGNSVALISEIPL